MTTWFAIKQENHAFHLTFLAYPITILYYASLYAQKSDGSSAIFEFSRDIHFRMKKLWLFQKEPSKFICAESSSFSHHLTSNGHFCWPQGQSSKLCEILSEIKQHFIPLLPGKIYWLEIWLNDFFGSKCSDRQEMLKTRQNKSLWAEKSMTYVNEHEMNFHSIIRLSSFSMRREVAKSNLLRNP